MGTGVFPGGGKNSRAAGMMRTLFPEFVLGIAALLVTMNSSAF